MGKGARARTFTEHPLPPPRRMHYPNSYVYNAAKHFCSVRPPIHVTVVVTYLHTITING